MSILQQRLRRGPQPLPANNHSQRLGSSVHVQLVTDGPCVQHALDIDGNDVAMSEFAGKTLLIVNVASACGYTDQNYKGLQELYTKYGGYGLEILAFPSNQFGGQEPGDEAAIKKFATEKYGVNFRLMSKVDVNGPAAHPIYKCAPLRSAAARRPGLMQSHWLSLASPANHH